MAKSFKGVAYWSGSGLPGGWLNDALSTLRPVEAAGYAVGITDAVAGRSLVVAKPKGTPAPVELLSLQVSGDATNGVVAEGPDAGAIIVLLTALCRKPGGIILVDDSSEPLSTRISASYPPFAADKERTFELAGLLGLVADQAFRERNRAMFARVL